MRRSDFSAEAPCEDSDQLGSPPLASNRAPPHQFSMGRERCRFQNRRPADNFRLYQASETGRRSLLLGRDRSSQVGEALLDGRIIKRLIQGGGKPRNNFLRCALRSKNAGPNAHLIVDPALLGRWDVGQRSKALVGGN